MSFRARHRRTEEISAGNGGAEGENPQTGPETIQETSPQEAPSARSGPLGRRRFSLSRYARIGAWSAAVAGGATLFVFLVRILMAAVLVAPAAAGAVKSAPAVARVPDRTTPGALASGSAAAGSPSSAVPCGAPVCPLGVPGSWAISFDDEFDGTALDRSKWSAMDGTTVNGVTALASNVAVAGGFLTLTLSDPHHGANVGSAPFDGAGREGYLLPVGSYTEARIMFPGNGESIHNWTAWWTTSGPRWPAGGEFDITEALGTLWTVYHGAHDAHFGETVPGVWSNQFHVYGVYRGVDHADVYWDGKKVASYPTADNGAGQGLRLTVGNGPWGDGVVVTGAASQVKVDYVRAWRPGS